MRACRIDAAAGRARGLATVPADHPMLVDHFPGAPLLPGTLGLEIAAQLAGPLAEETDAMTRGTAGARWALVSMVRDAKFLRPVPLPAQLDIDAEVHRTDAASVGMRVVLRVADVACIRAELIMVLVSVDSAHGDALLARDARLRAWKTAWARSSRGGSTA